MFRQIWNALFNRQSSSDNPARSMIYLSPEEISACQAMHTENASSNFDSTGFEKMSDEMLMNIFDSYYDIPMDDGEESFSPAVVRNYNNYAKAYNELSTRGPGIREWAIARLRHPDYYAREAAAYLVGTLASRDQLGEMREQASNELFWLATRSMEEDNKEKQGNDSALMTLGEIGGPKAISACRYILTSVEWMQDETQWVAAEQLAGLVNETFMEAEDPVIAAQEWLENSPG